MNLARPAGFVRRQWPLLVILGLFVMGLVLFLFNWPNPPRAQALGSFLGFLGGLALLIVTWLYVIAIREELDLFREQWEEGHAVQTALSLSVDTAKPRSLYHGRPGNDRLLNCWTIYVEVWNPGQRVFKVSAVRFYRQSAGQAAAVQCQRFVMPGRVARIEVTKKVLGVFSLYDSHIELLEYPKAVRDDLAIQIEYTVGRGLFTSQREVFDVCVQIQGDVIATVVAEPAMTTAARSANPNL